MTTAYWQVDATASIPTVHNIEIRQYTTNELIEAVPWLAHATKSRVKVLAWLLSMAAAGWVEFWDTAEKLGAAVCGGICGKTAKRALHELQRERILPPPEVRYKGMDLRLPHGKLAKVRRPWINVRLLKFDFGRLLQWVMKRQGFTFEVPEAAAPLTPDVGCGGVNGDPVVCSDKGHLSVPQGTNVPRSLNSDPRSRSPLPPTPLAHALERTPDTEQECGGAVGPESDEGSCMVTTVELDAEAWSPPEPDDAEPMAAEVAADGESQQAGEADDAEDVNAAATSSQDGLSEAELGPTTPTVLDAVLKVGEAVQAHVGRIEMNRPRQRVVRRMLKNGFSVETLCLVIAKQAAIRRADADPLILFGGQNASVRVDKLAGNYVIAPKGPPKAVPTAPPKGWAPGVREPPELRGMIAAFLQHGTLPSYRWKF